MTGHEYWEEQAAGYALDALEPDEAAEFARHLADCTQCQALADQHALVAAQLGALAYDEQHPAPTWADLRAGVIGPADETASNVVPIHRRRAIALVSAAAAAVAVIVGVTVSQTGGGSSQGPLTSAAACAETAGCQIVGLAATTEKQVPVSVLVYGHDVSIIATMLGRPPAGSEWALWRLPKSGAPHLMTTFEDVNGTRTTLDVPYADIAGFAVSREPAGTTPAAPSTVVASGTVA